MKKIFKGTLVLSVVIVILLLTFQDSAGTVRLSESFRLWLDGIGIHSDFHSIRSNAHLVIYFILGVVLGIFGKEVGWKWWVALLIGFGIGLIDESLRILLPTREFEVIDLYKDWIGIVIGVLVIWITNTVRKRE